MGTHKHHRYLTGARMAKADEFYTTYDAIDRELSHYRHDLAGRHVICDCNDRPGMSMFVRWTLDHMSEYGIASLTCTSFEADHGTLFDDGTPAMQWHVDNDGREGRYSIADLAARPLDGDGSFDSPECERLLDRPGAIVVTNPPFSKAIRFMRMLRRHPDTDFLIVANLNLATANDVFPMVRGGRCLVGLSIHSGSMFFRLPDDRPKTGSMIRPDGTVGVNSVRWLTSLAAARADKTWTPTGHTYRGHEDEYPEYDAYDAINVDSMRMMPDDHDGPMGVPLNFLEHWAPGNGFMLLGKLDDPTVNGRRLYKRLLVRRTRDA